MAGDLRVHVTLIGATPEHLQDDLRVLGIVLVPRVEHRFALPRLCHGIDADHLVPGREQTVSQRALAVAGRFKRYPAIAG